MEDRKKKKILIDADAWVAFIYRDDAHHERASELFDIFEHSKDSMITTNYVFAEAITVISRRAGHKRALAFIESLQSPASHLSVLYANAHIDSLAAAVFKRQTSKNVSFIDCANMAIMDELNLDAIFSFDKIYQKNNYRLATEVVG